MTPRPTADRISGIRVVLFCKGRGANAENYRPNSDDTQWWGRRDALVRCVASFLFGPAATAEQTNCRELVLVFDDDGAVLRMSTDTFHESSSPQISFATKKTTTNMTTVSQATTMPTEQATIQLWKRAAQNPGQIVAMNGMKCSIHINPSVVKDTLSEKGKQKIQYGAASSPSGLTNKRQMLEYMQRHCSIDFLREHGLNSQPESVLRKSNRTSLFKIWKKWNPDIRQGVKGEAIRSSVSPSVQQLCQFYRDMLNIPPEKQREGIRVVAGLLHESFPEFPCFNVEVSAAESAKLSATFSKSKYFVCLFLGAVRDMIAEENAELRRTCTNVDVPCLGIRFGTVPEFTSKILSLLAFHHSNHVVGTAIDRLLHRSQKTSREIIPQLPSNPTCLNVVCVVPIASNDVSPDLANRTPTIWSMVRVIVCTLWRSKLASSQAITHQNSLSEHTNSLHLVFDDDVVLHLTESDFVAKLASQHQAAPSENQILSALVQERKDKSSGIVADQKCSKRLARSIINNVMMNSTSPVTLAIGIGPHRNASNTLVSNFYGGRPDKARDNRNDVHFGFLAILDLEGKQKYIHDQEVSKDKEDSKSSKMYKKLLSVCEKMNVPTTLQNLVDGLVCVDKEAASIVALQHFCYQRRVFRSENFSSQEINATEKKRKRGS